MGWKLPKVKEPASFVREIALGHLALGDRRCVFEVNPVSVVALEAARTVDLMAFRSKGGTPYSYGDPSAGTAAATREA